MLPSFTRVTLCLLALLGQVTWMRGGGGGLDFPIHSEHFARTHVGGEVSEIFGNSALGEKPGAPPMGEGLGGWRQGLRTLTAMSYVLTHFTASHSSAYQSHRHSPRATLKNL